MLTRRRCLAGLLACASAPAPALATPTTNPPMTQPHGRVLLSVSGQIARTNAAGRADFDADMMAALPQHQIVTHTPWHTGPQTFTGPLLRTVLEETRAGGRTIHAQALDDYRCDIPVEDATRFDVVIARLHNGAPMRVRDSGPLRIVYPFDSDPQLRVERYYARAIWQLRSLTVLP
jgi:hypothetical protein